VDIAALSPSLPLRVSQGCIMKVRTMTPRPTSAPVDPSQACVCKWEGWESLSSSTSLGYKYIETPHARARVCVCLFPFWGTCVDCGSQCLTSLFGRLPKTESFFDNGGGEGTGRPDGIAVFGQAPSGGARGKSLWDVVRKSVETEELWTKEAIWREVCHPSDGVKCTCPQHSTVLSLTCLCE